MLQPRRRPNRSSRREHFRHRELGIELGLLLFPEFLTCLVPGILNRNYESTETERLCGRGAEPESGGYGNSSVVNGDGGKCSGNARVRSYCGLTSKLCLSMGLSLTIPGGGGGIEGDAAKGAGPETRVTNKDFLYMV